MPEEPAPWGFSCRGKHLTVGETLFFILCSVSRFARNASSLAWFPGTASPLLSDTLQVSLYNKIPVFKVFLCTCHLLVCPSSYEKIVVITHRAPKIWKAYIQWDVAWCPKGTAHNTAITTQCHAALGTMPHTWDCVNHCPLAVYRL